MLIAATGQAEGIDTASVIQRVLHQCRRQLGDLRPQAGVVFAGAEFDHRPMLDAIHGAFPGIELIGCTTTGDFASCCDFSDDAITLMVLCSDRVQVKAGLGRRLSGDPLSAAKEAVSAARRRLTLPPAISLVLPDGYNKSVNRMLEALNRELGSACPVFGGCAARNEDAGGPILQFYGREIVSDALPVLLLAGPVDFSFAVSNSWKPLGPRKPVTRAEGRRVYRIGEQSALAFYRHYLGSHSEPAIVFPLAVYEPGSLHFYLRGPVSYNPEDGSVTFTEAVPQGSVVQITEAIRNHLLDDARASARALAQGYPNRPPALALAFSCSLRKDVLGTRTREELQILKRALPERLPIAGFYAYGEIGPLASGGAAFFHNATLVTLLLGDGERPPMVDASMPAAHPDAAAALSPPQNALKSLQADNAFLRRRLLRSEAYRRRLEEDQERNTALHLQIIQEMEAARRRIQHQEAALRKSEEKYRRIVETTGEGFLLLDEQLALVDVNAAFCRLVGYTRQELLFHSSFNPAAREFGGLLRNRRADLLASPYREFEGTLVAKNGRRVPVLVHSNLLKDDQGVVIGNMAFVTDMTAQKKALLLAGEVQKNLLPRFKPQVRGLDVAGRSVSFDEIGGDYFDYLWEPGRPDEPFSAVVGDIAGHGIDSALLMTTARAFLRMRATQPGGMDDIITDMNRHLTRDMQESGRFMTLFYLTIDAARQKLAWVRAGHDPALLYDAVGDTFHALGGRGLALGVQVDGIFQKNIRTGLSGGQIIAIGTDGIWEATNPRGEMFGKRRFRGLIRENAWKDADGLLDSVFEELQGHTDGLKPEDDITLVIIKIGDQPVLDFSI